VSAINDENDNMEDTPETPKDSQMQNTRPSDSDGVRTALNKLNAAEGLVETTAQQPKKKQTLPAVGGLLVLGGIIVLRQGGTMQAFYNDIHEEGSTWWGFAVGGLLILVGGLMLIVSLARKLNESD
jgi:hypothetical protein